jgi:glucuronyl/N-acetylglucosaminyl transferase EXT2
LQLSIQHHLSCPSVLQIQIVWCLDQSVSVPKWLLEFEQEDPVFYNVTNNQRMEQISYPRVVVERHEINSLNERFHALSPVVTAGVLSIDDDVLYPCLAIDTAFQKWVLNPNRQVGFDARSHDIVYIDQNGVEHHHNPHNGSNLTPQWKYSYMSVTEKTNLYSLTLTRYSFLHRDYLTMYMHDMPQEIRDMVAQNFNCEDIAMSLYISSCTQDHPPLLADMWVVKSQIKMYVAKKISGTSNHKSVRDTCVHTFSQLLRLQHFHTVPLNLGSPFEYGDIATNWNAPNVRPISQWPIWHQDALETVERWRQFISTSEKAKMMNEMRQLHSIASKPIYDAGFIEKTTPWKERYGNLKPKL